MPRSNPSPGVEALQRLVHTGPETQGQSITSTTQSLRLMMNFLTLCCTASSRLRSEVSVSALLSTVATCTSKFDCSRLICLLLTTHSSIGYSRSQNSWTRDRFPGAGVNEIPWEIALSFPRSDLLVASCLASCVLAVDHLGSLAASTTVGIWEYLRDALLLILAENYVGDEELLGLLVAPTLCEALCALLRQTRDELGNWFTDPELKTTLTVTCILKSNLGLVLSVGQGPVCGAPRAS